MTITQRIRLFLIRALVLSTLVITTACSSLDSTPYIEDSNASPGSFEQSSSDRSNTQALPQSTQGRPLWIWIAPQYRADMPEGTGEYLIETI